MILTYKTRIIPTEEQEQVLWDLAEQCRLLYNFALTERKVIWQQEKDNPFRRFAALLTVDGTGNLLESNFVLRDERGLISYDDQQNALPALKKRYPNYQWVYSKVLQSVLRTLDADYKSFMALWMKGDTKARPPKYKGKAYFTTLKYNQSGFKLEEGVLTLSHKHPSKQALSFRLPYLPAGTIKQVELYQDHRTKKWFVSFNCEIKTLEHYDNGLYQAFDTGIENIIAAVNSQGQFLKVKNRRPDKYWKKKIAEVQARRDHCIEYSSKWYWFHNKLYRMIRKLANQLLDFQHWLSKKIVTQTKANTLIFGKPSVKKMAKKKQGTGNAQQTKANKTLNFSLQNTGTMARFIELVTYKAEKLGKRVIPIDEAYTTLICPRCGAMKFKQLSERTLKCNNRKSKSKSKSKSNRNCGLEIDRDLAAAINILAKFYLTKGDFENLLHEPSVNEESFFLVWKGFLRQTAEGKTKVPIADFWQRFGGLAGKMISPSVFSEDRGLTPTVFN